MTRSYVELDADMTAPGQFFEIETVEALGRQTRVWKAAPASLGVVLEQGHTVGGDRTFIVLDGEHLTHQQHYERVLACADRLVNELGVAKGDRVAIAMRNCPEWSIAFFAATLVAAIAVPLNSFWNGAELAFAVTDAQARVLVADGPRLQRLAPYAAQLGDVALVGTRLNERQDSTDLPVGVLDFAELLARAEPDAAPRVTVDPDDYATIFYTAGTTGHPKGVLGTHRNICNNLVSQMYIAAREAKRADPPPGSGPPTPPVTLVPVPLFHVFGCHGLLVSHAAAGGTLVFMRKWDPEVALDLIEREAVTSFPSVPVMISDVLNSPTLAQRDLNHITVLGATGSANPPELRRRAAAHFPRSVTQTGYGLTETSAAVATIFGEDYARHPDSVGVTIPVCDLRVVAQDGTDVTPGERGELWVRGPNIVAGYWHHPAETAASFTDGWFHTGDIVRIDKEGFLYIVDRVKDIIIRGGENVGSAEVEAALHEHPDVTEAAVFAVPDPRWGETVGAVVRLRQGSTADPDDLRTHTGTRLAAYMVPTRIWLTSEPLPRNALGKILKQELRNHFLTEEVQPERQGWKR